MPDSTADQVIEQQSKLDSIYGIVVSVTTEANSTLAMIHGQWVNNSNLPNNFWFLFPPNDPKYLTELVRAMNYPHLRALVQTDVSQGQTTSTMINFV